MSHIQKMKDLEEQRIQQALNNRKQNFQSSFFFLFLFKKKI